MAGSGIGLTKNEVKSWVEERLGPDNTFNLAFLEDFQAQVILKVKAQGKDRCNGPHYEQTRYFPRF